MGSRFAIGADFGVLNGNDVDIPTSAGCDCCCSSNCNCDDNNDAESSSISIVLISRDDTVVDAGVDRAVIVE